MFKNTGLRSEKMMNNFTEWYEVEDVDYERKRLKDEHDADEADRLWAEEKALHQWSDNWPSELPR